MTGRFILIASALWAGACGFAAVFLPQNMSASLAIERSLATDVVIQLLGGCLFGFAMMNWMAKGSRIGGIYNKPLAVGNLMHFMIGAFTLFKLASAGTLLVIAAGIYAAFAVAFGLLVFGFIQPTD